MKVTDVLLGHILLEYKETKVRGILNNKGLMDAIQKRAESDSSANFRPEADPEGELVHPAENVLRSLAEADPTANSQYLNWVLNRYKDGNFMMEDVPRINVDLQDFEKFKNQMPSKDINTYKSLSELLDALDSAKEQGQEKSARQEKSEVVDRIKNNEIDVVIKEGNFMVLSPKTPEASNYLGFWTGRKLRWCTLNHKPLPNYAPDGYNRTERYNSEGVLYQIIVNHGSPNVRSFLIHYESSQFMNEDNIQIEQDDIEMLSEIPAYKEFLNFLINKYYGKYFTDEQE